MGGAAISNFWFKMTNLWRRILSIIADRRTLIAVIALAFATFFFLHGYVPRLGMIWNINHGEIWLTSQCSQQESVSVAPGGGYIVPVEGNPFAEGATPMLPPNPMSCVIRVQYRILLALMIGLIAAHLMLRAKRSP
jgi:hypothetical protein